jgi:hypothetical protein
MSDNKTIVKSGKKVLQNEPIENINQMSNILQKDILAQFEKSKKLLLKTVEDFDTPTPVLESIQLFIETTNMYLQITNLIKKSTKKGGRKKSDFQFDLAVDVILEYLSEHFIGALPRKIKYPTGIYLHTATNEKITKYNQEHNTSHPHISERTADSWLKEFKSIR